MSEFQRVIYNFNDRIKLNDVTTDTTKYVLVDSSAFLDTLAQNTEEPRATDFGIIDYGTHLSKGTAKIPVILYAETEAKMNGLIQTFKSAFDPEQLEADATYGEAAGKDGYMPLKWTETVDTTSRAFQIFLKSVETPRVAMDNMAGTVRASVLTLKAQDPRKYLQTQSSLVGAGTASNAGTTTTPVEITIVANGATATDLTITNSTRSESLIISTALSAGQTLVIDTRLHSVKLNGTERRDYLSSSSKWMLLNSGNNTIAITNTTGVASITEKWYSAWPL
jgi:hypothetical protein